MGGRDQRCTHPDRRFVALGLAAGEHCRVVAFAHRRDARGTQFLTQRFGERFQSLAIMSGGGLYPILLLVLLPQPAGIVVKLRIQRRADFRCAFDLDF